MLKSLKLSHFLIRIGLAAVFLWFGIDKFFHPIYWINAWIPKWLIQNAIYFKINETSLVYLFGVFEILVGVSLVSGVFMRFFSFLAILFLVTISIIYGFNEVIIRDLGLIGGFLSLLFWPSKNRGVY